MKKLSISIVLVILLNATVGWAQISTFYSGVIHSSGHTAALTSDGKCVIGGDVDTYGFVLKTSISGDLQWRKAYDPGPSASETFISIREYDAENIVGIASHNAGSNIHFVRLDQHGNTLVSKLLFYDELIYPECMQVVKNASGAPTGTIIVGEADNRPFIHFTNENGDGISTLRLSEPGRAKWVEQIADGFVVLIDEVTGGLRVLKIDNDGFPIWTNTYQPTEKARHLFGKSIKQFNSAFYVTGSYDDAIAFIIRLNLNGSLNWIRKYGAYTGGSSLTITEEVAGIGGIFLTGIAPLDDANAVLILNTDFSGMPKWAKIYRTIGHGFGQEIISRRDSLTVVGLDAAGGIVAIRTDLRGRSGAICESTISLRPQTPTVMVGQTPVRYTPIKLTESKADPLVDFELGRLFCPPGNALRAAAETETHNSVVVYPTVASTMISVDLKTPTDDEGTLTVYGFNKKIQTQTIPRGAAHIDVDVSHLAPGLYYLMISTNRKKSSVKFIKQ